MKKSITILMLIFSIQLFTVIHLYAQNRANQQPRSSPNASVSQTIGTTVVEVTYGRPSVNERLIFGSLVPLGQVWRTGANESTAITFSDNVLVEGNEIEAGTYSLFTIPDDDQWTIIINETLTWGTRYDESADVVRFEVTPEESYFAEQMIIYFENVTASDADLVIHWDETKVPINIRIN
ncbi:MAG: DUF2911 domain-containing protein [Balneolaceae bacterium]